jgi:hypothetical protein
MPHVNATAPYSDSRGYGECNPEDAGPYTNRWRGLVRRGSHETAHFLNESRSICAHDFNVASWLDAGCTQVLLSLVQEDV